MSSIPQGHAFSSPASLPSLRIHNPEDTPPDPQLPTIRDVWQDILLPQLTNPDNPRAPETIKDIARAVDRWEEFWLANLDWRPAVSKWSRSASAEYRMQSPVLTIGVTVAHLEHWRKHLPGAPRTKNKYVKAIQQILKSCIPHDIPTSHAKAVSLPQAQPVKYYLSAEQLCQMWPHADVLEWPRVEGITTADWWRSLIAMYWTYGFRLEDLFDVKASSNRQVPSLQWSSITRDPMTPNPNGRATNELGWLSYTPSKTRRHRPTPLFLPITRVADAALRRFGFLGGSGSIVKAPRCSRDFYKAWKQWQKLAGVSNRAGQPYNPYALRKSCATYLDAHCHGLADAVIGWSSGNKSKMGDEVYINTEPILIAHLPTYRYPDCFADFV